MFKNISISFKIIGLSVFLAVIFLGSSFVYVVVNARDQFINSSTYSLEVEVNSLKERIEGLNNVVQGTVFALKETPPFQGIIRAQSNDGFDIVDNSTQEQWEKRLQSIFVAEMNATGFYDQLRYIDENGQELVRVDYKNSLAKIVDTFNLQNKKDRDYFVEAQEVTTDELYISNTELNREGSPAVISIPHRPVVRYATPIFNKETREKEGIIIANILIDKLINENFSHDDFSRTYIFNSDGFFIFHPDSSKEWGGPKDLNTGVNIFSEFPGIKNGFFEDASGSFSLGSDFFYYAKLDINPSENNSQEWVILERISIATFMAPVNSLVKNTFFIGIGVFFLLSLVFIFGIKSLLKPLSHLSYSAGKIGLGDFDTEIVVSSGDEIGRVAEAFNLMKSKLRGLYKSLENQVELKTSDLRNKVQELEKTKVAMVNILEDIGAEKEKLETILEGIGDAVFVVDKNLNIVIFNKTASVLSGFSVEEAIGKPYYNILNFVHELDGEISESFIKNALISGEVQEMEHDTELIRKDGKKIAVADSAAPLKDANNNVIGVVVVFRDVGKERDVDRAKTEFVSLASHQLRTPLTAIRWYTELLLSDESTAQLGDEQKEYLGEIANGNTRMIDLVNALLNVSRIELGTFAVDIENINMKTFLGNILKDLEFMSQKKKQTLEIVSEDAPEFYQADPKLLGMILQNLVSNAIKYTPEGGKVTVKVSQNDSLLQIDVADNGYGIPQQQQEKIFEKLFRADNVKNQDTTGTGLGLYIVKAILEQTGGRIWFESEENKGTHFHVELPLSGMKQKDGAKPLEV